MGISTEALLKKRQDLVDNYLSDDFDVEAWLQGRKEMEDIVNNCKFETPEEVANHFIAYTALIWDYKMLGKIHECYMDSIIIHRDGGEDCVSLAGVIQDTQHMLAASSNLRLVFYNIFCERYDGPGGGYRFGQATRWMGVNDGWSRNGAPTYKKFEDEHVLGMCECLVQFVNGRWRITEEWGVRSADAFERAFTRDKQKG